MTPARLERCVRKVKRKIRAGKMRKGSSAHAICIKSTGLRPHRERRKKR